MGDNSQARPEASLPLWVPDAAEHYLLHTETGLSIRAVARVAGCHASTVLRQIRRYENRRDDPLIDQALRRLGVHFAAQTDDPKDLAYMPSVRQSRPATKEDHVLTKEARRVLRRLCDAGAVLLVLPKMDNAVVVRNASDGAPTTLATTKREYAEAMALKEWISCKRAGRVVQYVITSAGKTALKAMLGAETNAQVGFAEAPAAFLGAKRVDNVVQLHDEDMIRPTLAESPLLSLARRRDKSGKPFLDDKLVATGERFREDFELAQMEQRNDTKWEEYLTDQTPLEPKLIEAGQGSGAEAARARVQAALRELGTGLGDVALGCCCNYEGMETAEKRLGWSARSGKIVLKIALERLHRHYERLYGPYGPMIG